MERSIESAITGSETSATGSFGSCPARRYGSNEETAVIDIIPPDATVYLESRGILWEEKYLYKSEY
jgi:hypothetical protein